MKKFFILLILVFFSASMLFVGISCKGTEVAEETSEEIVEAEEETSEEIVEAEEEAEQIELTWWNHWFSYVDYFAWVKDEVIPAFEASHPNVTVEAVHIPYANFEAKYLSAFTTRENAPDIFLGSGPYYALGLGVADMAKGEIKDYFLENVVPAIQQTMIFDGEVYGKPGSCDLSMMYIYNRHMYEEAGLDPDDPPETIEEFLEVSKKLTKADGSQYGFAIRYSGNKQGLADKFIPFLHAFGGRMYSPDGKVASGYVNSEESIAALQFYSDLVYEYKVASLEVGTPRDAFGQGLAAGLFREAFMVAYMESNFGWIADEDYSFAPLPNGAVDPGWCTFFADVDMVYKYAPEADKEAAWEFLKFLFEPEQDWIRSTEKITGLPANKILWETKKDELEKSPYYEESIEIVEDEPMFYDSPIIIELAISLGQAIENVLFAQTDPKEELDKAAETMDQALNNYWSSIE